MPDTILFAPVVRAIQPAFIYNQKEGGVTVYFSLSAYNKINEIDSIRFTLIDPNQPSTWGNNSMIIEGNDIIEKTNIKQVENSDELYIIIENNKFKTLNTNKFYQMQLYLRKGKEESEPSQVTLIRPIDKPTLTIEGFEGNNIELTNFLWLNGSVKYTNDSSNIETIVYYKYTICNNNYKNEENVLYSSPKILNELGTKFSTKIDFNFEPKKTYFLKFEYETKHGYVSTDFNKQFTIASDSLEDDKTQCFKITSGYPHLDLASGSLKFNFKIDFTKLKNPVDEGGSYITVQRTSNFNNYKKWDTISKIRVDYGYPDSIEWLDSFIQGVTDYKYRFIYNDSLVLYTTNIISVAFDDIFLSDNDMMIAVRYNPVISNFKWVTQDSITNTLGGRYPIVRRNGDTYYRQFTLTGTLFLNFEGDPIQDYVDSCYQDMSQWVDVDEGSLFLGQDTAYEYSINQNKTRLLKNRPHDIAMQFLTNGKPKLFRSPTEDNMVIYLSNVNFTPNKTLGRQIYDFSATATEICEPTDENFAFYGLDRKLDYKMIIVLNAISSQKTPEDAVQYAAYIRPSEILDYADGQKRIRFVAKFATTDRG